jgi:hypothetical protein
MPVARGILNRPTNKSPKVLFQTLDKLLEKPPSDDPAVLETIRKQVAL